MRIEVELLLGPVGRAAQEAAALDDDEDFEGPPLELSDAASDDPEDPSEDLAVDEASFEASLDLMPEEAAGLEGLEAERLSVL